VELVHRPATEPTALVASAGVSADELFEAHVRSIDRSANAVVAVAEFVEPVPGPLRGVPFTVKDNIAVAGLPLVLGVPERRGVIANFDATVVRGLRSAGAVLVAKTNLPPHHVRGLALLRGRGDRPRPAAALGRLPLGDVVVRRGIRRHPLPCVPDARSTARRSPE
jgi:Asp-tRNA(Asn)/Glu-tRNA(Gln) amidotransferase A subunit family amidase